MNRVVAILFAFVAGCAAQVGDECESSVDCGRALDCDLSQPGGYCTVSPCTVNGCPEEAACITFPDDTTWCMARCESGDDCRDGYTCVQNYGDVGFCNAQPFLGR